MLTRHDRKDNGVEVVAHGGTVFFDEIGDISPELQTKMLRFLQEREFERVGGTQTVRVDARIIAATNRDLEGAVREGRFREDLYHRLNVIPIALPPLRERREDIPVLVQFLIQRFSKETKKQFTAIDPQAQESLVAYGWPGNVRELANVIERAIVLGQGPEIGLKDLPARITTAEIRPRGETLSYREAVNSHRRELVLRALQQSEGNRSAAAKALGLHEKYFLKLAKSLGIK